MKRQAVIHQVFSILLLTVVLVLHSGDTHAQSRGRTFIPVAPEILSNSFVRCFFKDSRGFIWLGTSEGLIRYDGANVVRYEHDPSDHTTIPHNLINVISEDADKTLWIGTGEGLVKFSRELDRFINVDSIPGSVNHLNSRFITGLAFDHQGHVWIGTHGKGINVYDPVGLTFRYLSSQSDNHGNKSSEFVTSLLYHDDLMWCGTKRGVELYNASDKKRISFTCLESSVPTSEISQVAKDNTGSIWLASVTGDVVKLTEGNGYYTCKTILSGQVRFGPGWAGIRALTLDGKGNFWIAGENAGLNYLDTRTGEVTHFPIGNEQWGNLPTNSILTVFVDNSGLTWIGTVNQGAFMIDDNSRKFNLYDLSSIRTKKIVRGLAEDAQGKIWIALESVGLATLDLTRGDGLKIETELNALLPNKFLTSLLCDRSGNLWIGTAGSGVYKLNRSDRRLQHFTVTSNGLGDNKLYCLYEDRKGNVWAGSAGSGLFYFDSALNRFVLLAESDKRHHIAGTTYVTSIQEDSQNILWVGTLHGLYSITYREDGSTQYDWFGHTDDGRLSGNVIQTVFEDRRKNLWVATSDNGLNVKWRGEDKFQPFKKSDGLASNALRSIVSDSKGNLWIGTNMGLSKFDIMTHSFTNYSRNDGLASNTFNENAALRSTRGSLFFGSNNGVNSFYPDSLRIDSSKPVVYLSDLKINNQSAKIGEEKSPLTRHISLTKKIALDHTQRSFTIDFATINYTHGLSPKYCYMLKEFDRDWNCLASTNSANYTNIDPGEYVFLVKASNSDGVWSDEPTELIITIHPAPWNTWWAVLSYCIVAGLVAYFLLRLRMDRLHMQNQLKLERIAHERERELIESKTQFFTNVSHEFRTPLSLILLPLETLMTSTQIPQSIKNKISIAHNSAEKMMNLVNELMDFNKVESRTMKLNLIKGDVVSFVREVTSSFYDLAIRRNIRFEVVSELASIRGLYDPPKLEKIVFNLLSNAFKFTADGGEIRLLIDEKNAPNREAESARCIELVILDNGIGIDANELPLIFDKFYQAKSASKVANPGTGIGLSLTKALIELHGGAIKAESIQGETKFTALIPIEHFSISTEIAFQEPEQAVTLQEEAVLNDQTDDKAEILLVEDNTELRKHLAAELSSEYIVFESSNGAEGIKIALDKIPDLVISDILMASKNGLELCKTLKSDVKTSHIPIILLTAKASVEEQIIGIESGADVYITKPFNYRYLLTHIRNIISSREKLYAHFSKDVYLLPAKVATNAIDQAFLQRAIDYIITHIQDPQLSVDSIADHFNLSRVQVYRKIKALTGKSAVELTRSVRLKEALRLMETKKYTLAEIAYQTGFNSPSYFTRSFKEEYGKAPSEFLEAKAT